MNITTQGKTTIFSLWPGLTFSLWPGSHYWHKRSNWYVIMSLVWTRRIRSWTQTRRKVSSFLVYVIVRIITFLLREESLAQNVLHLCGKCYNTNAMHCSTFISTPRLQFSTIICNALWVKQQQKSISPFQHDPQFWLWLTWWYSYQCQPVITMHRPVTRPDCIHLSLISPDSVSIQNHQLLLPVESLNLKSITGNLSFLLGFAG